MSHWSPNESASQTTLFTSLWLTVLTVHLALISLYAFFERPQPLTIKISRSFVRFNRPVKVLAFVQQTGQLHRFLKEPYITNKSIPATATKTTSRPVLTRQAKTTRKHHISQQPKAASQKLIVHKKLAISPKNNTKLTIKKKIKKQTTLMQKSENKSVKKISKKTVQVTTPSRSKNKKSPPPITQKEYVQPAKTIDQQPPPIPSKQPPSPPEPKPIIQDPVDSLVTPETQHEELNQPAEPFDIALTDNQEVVLGIQEYEALQTYQLIQNQMNSNWHPPAGLAPKQACIILVDVASNGTIIHTTIEQASGIRAYDMAARMAVTHTTFPKGVWEHQVRLHF